MSKNKRPIPHYQHPLIDTHCHLDYLKAQPLQQILQQNQAQGIERAITIAVSADNLQKVQHVAHSADNILFTQGIHPHEAKDYSPQVEQQIRQGLADRKCIAVGEIGLDYYYEHSDRQVQQQVFEQQLELACEHDLPVVIHTREADADTQAILSNFSQRLARKGVIHSFTSSLALAEFCLAEGFHLGFNGIITFNKADNVRAVCAATPMDRILLETDAPFLTPMPYRGKENAPYYLPLVAERVAQVQQQPIESALAQFYRNSLNCFNLAA